ncbi:glycosyltransferase family 2 protein [Lusitaniella coriacea LEGE 07157]|uniref:Glycosyltransferase family 2 protein n=1 Tax=Lusitaniella coriacea LEGE 07157 TaxID=945747 RepID=A0A8J7ITX6_9CYAN|nr:hormogonium polysaccharide biosynthesis glycosyltransferase HpsE [Lusitaniella coriacea]MBE9117152.1 glycosyltransferase family 2 protein [Lusitaniella coriacea LEGE 07157]
MTDFTVAIPTYNGAERLSGVLEKLQAQVETEAIAWEILIVDNNSRDNTAEVVRELQSHWNSPFPLKYCFEPQQGLAFAREKAVRTSDATFVGFLDDDNFVTQDWVAQAYQFGTQHSQAGSFGGQIHSDFEVEPPPEFKRVEHLLLAIREGGNEPQQFNPEKLQLPSGAGLVVRRQAWLDCVPKQLLNPGRGGNDYEISMNMYRGGWEIWYNPNMHLYHHIPSERLDREYLLSLAHLYGLRSCQWRMIPATTWQKPIVFSRTFLGGLRRLLRHVLKYRWQVKTDLVAACEFAFFWGSMMSPFYFLKRSLQKS